MDTSVTRKLCACGQPTTGGWAAKYCDPCRATAYAAIKKAAVQRYQVARGRNLGGTAVDCRRCGQQFSARKGHNYFCGACGLERVRDRKKLRRADPKWALSARMGGSIRTALRRKKGGQSWQSLVGYSVEELIAHMERQFLPGMTWKNLDQWHVDHIVPVVSFSFCCADDAEFKACWALTNLRPLWATDNNRKNARRIHLL